MAVSSLQVRHNLDAANQSGGFKNNGPSHDKKRHMHPNSRKEGISGENEPLLMSDWGEGEIYWETETETELDEDPRDALWDSDAVDGWSDVRSYVIMPLFSVYIRVLVKFATKCV